MILFDLGSLADAAQLHQGVPGVGLVLGAHDLGVVGRFDQAELDQFRIGKEIQRDEIGARLLERRVLLLEHGLRAAQQALGDIVFAEVPEAGRTLSKGQGAAVVESVKAASDVYAPVGGEVTEGNAALADDPALINRDPEGDGWFFKLKLSNPSEVDGLMDEASYRDWVKTL